MAWSSNVVWSDWPMRHSSQGSSVPKCLRIAGDRGYLSLTSPILCLVAFVLFTLINPVEGHAEAPSVPTIFLDPGTHTGPIRRIALNSAQTILVTTSDDKSARLWDLATGQSVATLHTPVGEGQLGRLYGAAISAQNRLAVGGTTGPAGALQLIYLFDLVNRGIAGSFDARGGNVKRLEWSPDGGLLAAAYADSPAVRVFDARGTPVYEERLDGDSYYLKFSAAGKMAVSASGGKIRIYETTRNRVTPLRTIVTALRDPRGIDFSPDGRLLAVGYLSRDPTDRVRVDVFDMKAGELARTFTFSDIPRGNLMNVTWNSDGSLIYAGGTGYRGSNRFLLKRITWPQGVATDVEIGSNSVLDLASLRDGRIVFASAEPAWGIVASDRIVKKIVPRTGQFLDVSCLQISDDAREISWKYEDGEKPVHFNLSTRKIDDGSANTRRHADASTWTVALTDWENNFNPKLSGLPIPLEPSEVSRAAAVLPDKSGVLLGTSRALRKLDAAGRQQWIARVSTEVRSVNIALDGKVAVTAMLDGSIQWWRISDGELLMSFVATRDRKWVVWTESGYFDIAPGAEDLIGWILNRPEGDRADYYPISRFRRKYYRPDVIDGILDAMDAQKALVAANEIRERMSASVDANEKERLNELISREALQNALPPTISLLSPANIETADSKIAIDYDIVSKEPVTSVFVRVDGRAYDLFTNELPSGEKKGHLLLTASEANGQIQLFAATKKGISVPITVNFTRSIIPAHPTASNEIVHRARLVLLVIGVGQYANRMYDLKPADTDAKNFARALQARETELHADVMVKLLTNETATREEILAGLRWVDLETRQADTAMIYLRGRALDSLANTYYFLPHDVNPGRLLTTSITEDDLASAVMSVKGKSMLFLDTPYPSTHRQGVLPPNLTRVANRLSSPEYGAIIFSANYARDASSMSGNLTSPAFTNALVEGISGEADYRRHGYISYSDLGYFLSTKVNELTSGSESSTITAPSGLGDFPIVRLEGRKVMR